MVPDDDNRVMGTLLPKVSRPFEGEEDSYI